MVRVTLPELGEGIAEATVACFHLKPGDPVSVDDDVVEVVTDKATFNVASTAAGRIAETFVAEGDQVPVGAALFSVSDS
ncbi:MAG: dihydrolipoamide succinyltransferase [Candidatus Omnitrophica bacterium]|nr:dihydrolipoamide succinyltransferase [Candidatus Omnitrophota bacterium]MCB9720719.1 dihydrolipoamide succinyltransferase [Candidatus Omnitrophota bacterium]